MTENTILELPDGTVEPRDVKSEIQVNFDEGCRITTLNFNFLLWDLPVFGSADAYILDPKYGSPDMLDTADCHSAELQYLYMLFAEWLQTNNKRDALTAYIEKIEIHSDLRNRGIGSACMNQVLQWFRRFRIRYVLLNAQLFTKDIKGWSQHEINQGQNRIAKFYQNFGFEVLDKDETGSYMFLRLY